MSIQCSQGHVNPDGSAFCDECGERLTPVAAGAAPSSGDDVTIGSAPTMAAPAPAPDPVAAAPVAPKLIVQSDNASFDLAGKSEVLIGREDEVSNIYPDIDLTPHNGEEGGVSRIHAKIFINGAQYLIEDQNSTNYTFVNRQKLAPKTPTEIKDGDEVRLGRVIMTFHTV